MNIKAFIEKYALHPYGNDTDVDRGPDGIEYQEVKPTPFALMPADNNDRVEIYTNENKTLWLSVNTSKQSFRVQFDDQVFFSSPWLLLDGMGYAVKPPACLPLECASWPRVWLIEFDERAQVFRLQTRAFGRSGFEDVDMHDVATFKTEEEARLAVVNLKKSLPSYWYEGHNPEMFARAKWTRVDWR